MVKIISNVKGDHVEASVELAGNMKTIVSELVNAIGSAYLQIGAQDKRAAQAFRKMFTQFVTSEDVANAIRCGASKDVIKALLEEM